MIQTHSHVMFYLCFPDVCAAWPGALGNKVLERHAEARRYAASTFAAARKEDHDSRLTLFSMTTSSFRLESIEVPKQAHVFRVCPVCVCFVLQACRLVWCPTGLIFLRGCPRSALERCDWACRHAALCVDRWRSHPLEGQGVEGQGIAHPGGPANASTAMEVRLVPCAVSSWQAREKRDANTWHPLQRESVLRLDSLHVCHLL